MKNMAAVILFFTCSLAARSQTLTVNGTNLFLGESEAAARADIAARGMKIQKAGSFFALTGKQGDVYDAFGEIGFKNGKVSWILRNWYLSSTPDDKNVLAAIFFSATTSLLEGADARTCSISVKSQDNSPSEGVSKTTRIHCITPRDSHDLFMVAVDCSSGCSIGHIFATLSESIY
jgi:hypothetical protein